MANAASMGPRHLSRGKRGASAPNELIHLSLKFSRTEQLKLPCADLTSHFDKPHLSNVYRSRVSRANQGPRYSFVAVATWRECLALRQRNFVGTACITTPDSGLRTRMTGSSTHNLSPLEKRLAMSVRVQYSTNAISAECFGTHTTPQAGCQNGPSCSASTPQDGLFLCKRGPMSTKKIWYFI